MEDGYVGLVSLVTGVVTGGVFIALTKQVEIGVFVFLLSPFVAIAVLSDGPVGYQALLDEMFGK